VIMDAPATGHTLALMRAPHTYANVARVGPVGRQAGQIDAFLRDPSATGVLSVALPEEMPVNETVDLERRLGDELGIGVDRIVANAVLPSRLNGAEAARLGPLRDNPAVQAALAEHHRAAAQREQLERLRAETQAPMTTLPYLFEPEPGRRELELLSDRLEEEL
jgi:anion-transporting  ArsA/GET3 family ATPase